MEDNLKDFLEDWDGEKVLGDVNNFESGEEFLREAQKYVNATRDEYSPVCDGAFTLKDIIFTDEVWMYKEIADQNKISGEHMKVYETEILYDFSYYTFSEKEQDQINDVLKEIEILIKSGEKDFDEWDIPVIAYLEDLDNYQKAEVRKVFAQKRERGEWS